MKSVSLKLLKSFRTDHDVRVIIQSVKNGPQGFVSEMCKNVPLVQISNEELSFKAIYIRFFLKQQVQLLQIDTFIGKTLKVDLFSSILDMKPICFTKHKPHTTHFMVYFSPNFIHWTHHNWNKYTR